MHWRTLITPLAFAALLLPGCGSGDETSEPPGDTPAPVDTVGDTTTTAVTTPDTTSDTDPAGSTGEDDGGTTTTAPQPATTVVDDVPATTAVTLPDPGGRDDLPGLIASGDLDVTIGVPAGGATGELFEVAITNTADGDLSFVVPCGLVFVPDGGDEQRMMNLRAFDLDLAAGESVTIEPFVGCIDGSAPAPDAGAAYRVGTYAGDDLLALAQCVCADTTLDELDPMEEMSLQMAIWAVAGGSLPDLDVALDQADGALGELVGGETGIDFDMIAELLEGQDIPGMEGIDLEVLLGQASVFLDTYLADAQAWIDRCEIDLTD